MKLVCPTITAENPHTYREQVERLQSFCHHVHLDVMDGKFTPNKSIDLEHLWLPDTMTCDVHVMFQDPERAIDELRKLSVRTVIVPAEADVDFSQLANKLHDRQIQFGVALLAETTVESAREAIRQADHVLIFSGNLGYQGGSKADLSLLAKIPKVKAINSRIEFGWDGGLNLETIKQISDAGVTVFNSGGFVQFAANPADAYAKLVHAVKD